MAMVVDRIAITTPLIHGVDVGLVVAVEVAELVLTAYVSVVVVVEELFMQTHGTANITRVKLMTEGVAMVVGRELVKTQMELEVRVESEVERVPEEVDYTEVPVAFTFGILITVQSEKQNLLATPTNPPPRSSAASAGSPSTPPWAPARLCQTFFQSTVESLFAAVASSSGCSCATSP